MSKGVEVGKEPIGIGDTKETLASTRYDTPRKPKPDASCDQAENLRSPCGELEGYDSDPGLGYEKRAGRLRS
ncbi:hypothetical protein EBR66_00360 [bacterium]|nr:hypothetical protein [bacterium]